MHSNSHTLLTLPPDTVDVLIVGCGDIGRNVARLEQAAGRSVAVLARSPEKIQDATERGWHVVTGDLDALSPAFSLPFTPKRLYWFAPPPSEGRSDPRLDAFLNRLVAVHQPEKVVYISTSGVYGDCQGDWVTEQTPPNPKTDRAYRRLAAEQNLAAWAERNGVDLVILRVPGIYGPGRLPVERIRMQVPVIHPDEAPYSNRIHADDLAAICQAAAWGTVKSGLFNVSDGHPTTMTDYFMQVADLLALPRPPCISLQEARNSFSASLLSFIEESRRIDNRLLLQSLPFRLRYPDLASGLAACLKPGHDVDR